MLALMPCAAKFTIKNAEKQTEGIKSRQKGYKGPHAPGEIAGRGICVESHKQDLILAKKTCQARYAGNGKRSQQKCDAGDGHIFS